MSRPSAKRVIKYLDVAVMKSPGSIPQTVVLTLTPLHKVEHEGRLQPIPKRRRL